MADAEDPLVASFSPPLVVLLTAVEREKGEPLTRSEVEQIRDEAVCMMVPRSIERALSESRGYHDIDPEAVWQSWCEVTAYDD